MTPLPLTFTDSGWNFSQLQRSGIIALYQKSRPDGSQLNLELIIVKPRPAHTWPNGTTTPPHETFPSSSEWGSQAWSFSLASHTHPIAAAKAKFDSLVNTPASSTTRSK